MIFQSYVKVYQRVNLHFPMVFPIKMVIAMVFMTEIHQKWPLQAAEFVPEWCPVARARALRLGRADAEGGLALPQNAMGFLEDPKERDIASTCIHYVHLIPIIHHVGCSEW